MTDATAQNWDMAIMLPLGVVASQLMKIETQLRHLNMKALVLTQQPDVGSLPGIVGAQLEAINEALDAIRGLVADMQADLQPKSAPSRDD